MEQKEFTIEQRKETFRVAKLSPTSLLALNMQMDFGDFAKTEATMSFIFEHLEVKVGDGWLPVKEKGRDIYWPKDLGDDFRALGALFAYFVREVLGPLFGKSSG